MSDTTFSIEDRIELLTEGELSPTEARRLFDECDGQPEHWRTLALAFVEAQYLRRGLGRSDRPEVQKTAVPESQTQLSASQHDLLVSSSQTKNESSSTPSQPARSRRSNRFFIATAACLLLCVGAVAGSVLKRGRIGSGSATPIALGGNDPNGTATTPTNADVLENPNTDRYRAGAEDAALVEAPRPEDDQLVVGYLKWIGQFGPQSAPVFRGDRLTPEVLNAYPTSVDSRTRQRFKRLGVQVSAKRRLVSLSLNGSEYMVAMEDLSLLPLSREIL
ncbi:MAG TPA: hypothetical protein DDW52_10345 [Planctomycetaceae bacterium]|nr:hypothetical protein [Planctomycetaceae bacterium]